MKVFNPHPYQLHASQHVVENQYCGLFLEMGLGKTVSTLTAIVELIKRGEVRKVLIVAPLRVAQSVWKQEAAKWQHTAHLTLSLVIGNREKLRKQALQDVADIYVINRENVPWLMAMYGGRSFPFDMLVIDELSSFKNHQAARFKALRKVRPIIKRVVGLTGTPAPNGLLDLWAQMYLLDRGQRLGDKITAYREKYFKPGNGKGFVVYEHNLKKGDDLLGEDIYTREIYDKIGDICVSMKAEDYLNLPPLLERDLWIDFPADLQRKYDAFERDLVMEIASSEITAVNAAALSTKLRQFSNGAVYDEDRNVHTVHDLKLEALEDIVEEQQGQPILIFYEFQHDLERITKRLKKYKPVRLKGDADVEAWNRGEISVMLTHPASAGHGLNLQYGGNVMVWFGLNWSLELYQQAVARLMRQGQTKRVIMHRLLCRETLDGEIVTRLENKGRTQDALMEAVKARIEKYTKTK